LGADHIDIATKHYLDHIRSRLAERKAKCGEQNEDTFRLI
jgi:hypothetical protein